jgi:SAM-dependent methyltransferase
MHKSAYKSCVDFHKTYSDYFPQDCHVVEIGSQNVNGSLRPIFSQNRYTGVDFAQGNGVDIVLTDPYKFPIPDESVDVVVSSSCFEHSEMFWITFLEAMRILKPTGLFYMNAPANWGAYHLYPVDCWRFLPDSGNALVSWAKRNGINAMLLESYLTHPDEDVWVDFIAVFLKEASHNQIYPFRILDSKTDFFNGHKNDLSSILNFVEYLKS